MRSNAWLPLAALALSGVMCKDRGGYPTRDRTTTPRPKSDGGALQITSSSNSCPKVTFAVSPPDAKVGEGMDVNATAVDPDPGDRISYAWTAGAGSFGDSQAAHTTYACSVTGAGPQTIVLLVSDGQCTVARTASVYCFAASVQVGTGGAGGGRGMGGAVGVQGTGGTGAAGSRESGDAGNVGGSGGASGEGAAGGTSGSVVAACAHDPTHDEGTACESCTRDNCVPAIDGCDDLPSDAKVAACQRLYCCIRGNACALDSVRGVLSCWCGSADYGICWTNSAAANGACLVEIREAADTIDAATIKQRFVDPSYALGRAVNLATCRASYCSDPVAGGNSTVPVCRL
jgi:hypothetical protein